MHRLSVALVICGLAAVVSAGTDSRTYIVKQGDTLSGIARQYYGDWRMWERIAQANYLQRPDRLREGQQLIIPAGDWPPPTAPSSDPEGESASVAVTLDQKQASLPVALPERAEATAISQLWPSADIPVTAVPAVTPVPVIVHAPAPSPSAMALDSDTLRRLAEAAVVRHYTNVNLAAYDPGYIVRLEAPKPEAETRVVVAWLGREPLALAKGATSDLDRKQVLKIEVWLTGDGRVLKVGDRRVWLARNIRTDPAP